MQLKEKRVYAGSPSSGTLQQVICFAAPNVTYGTLTGCPSPTPGSESHVAATSILSPPPYANNLALDIPIIQVHKIVLLPRLSL
jgi:hypothetical protein